SLARRSPFAAVARRTAVRHARTVAAIVIDEAAPANVGDLYETVEVKPGYMRNFLFPNQLAVYATHAAQQEYAPLRAAREAELQERLRAEEREAARAAEEQRKQEAEWAAKREKAATQEAAAKERKKEAAANERKKEAREAAGGAGESNDDTVEGWGYRSSYNWSGGFSYGGYGGYGASSY
ncbi:MAG: bL9 family ribosomal protein, partial [Pseudomonadota bacterium]|nr:bL9 family ribosomal protein [Pseudomonadota bacterium]